MSNRENSIVLKKTFDFAVKIVMFDSQLNAEKHYILGNQLLRSGTSIINTSKKQLANEDNTSKLSDDKNK